jgi:hypothetical protein
MIEDRQNRKLKRRRLWLALAFLAAILAVLIVPPFLSVSRFKSRITQLMSASLGRPVRLSSVEVRLLPRPGFVLTDLTVEEDPSDGAEPVLHANTVTASIRLLSLWRGRLEIGSISVDEASLNLVRTAAGRWNLDSIFRTAAAQDQPAGYSKRALSLPYLEATNSRINIMNGTEKLPFSLLNAKISFWQSGPGEWRIQLRGQPARTDVSLEQADTGVVRLEASLHRAATLRQMPLHIDLEWREAQLGQLSRLIIGSDPGWRGDLTGEMHLDGTAEVAQVTTRLRATGVHRAEFAPASPLDFDARCGFVYHFTVRSMENLACDSPLGDGHIRLAGDLPGEAGLPRLSVELDRIPVAAGLDALRTMRSGFAPGLVAAGTVSGKIAYSEAAAGSSATEKQTEHRAAKAKPGKGRSAKARPAVEGPLTGSFIVDGFQLSGEGLREPIRIPRLVFEPAASLPQGQQPEASQSSAPVSVLPSALAATVALPAGGTAPLMIASRLTLSGYRVNVRGQASIAQARDLARLAGLRDAAILDAVAGESLTVELNAVGPWRLAEKIPFSSPLPPAAFTSSPAASSPAPPPATEDADALPATDRLSGSVTLRNANWKADYLANAVQITQATLHLEDGQNRWDPVVFSYGPVKGTASLTLPFDCEASQPCLPSFQLQFGALDASTLQAAFLGAREPGTLLSTLIDRLGRLRPSASPAWPRMEGTVKVDSLLLGPVTLHDAKATVRILENGAEITGLDAGLLGGRVSGAGSLHAAATNQENPSYSFEGRFDKLNPQAVGPLLGQRWSGGVFEASGKIELSGFTEKDLAASAKGSLHFDWRNGAVSAAGGPLPAALTRFDRWTADAEIANGSIALGQNQIKRGSRSGAVEATATLGASSKVSFAAAKETPAKR